MRLFLFSFLILSSPLWLYGEDLKTLLKLRDNNPILRSLDAQISAKKALQEAQKSANYPTIDAKLNAIRLKDTPMANFHLPFEGMPPEIAVGTQTQIDGSVELRYPIFSGFAISALIEKAKLNTQKARLQKIDTKRQLTMQIITAYATAYKIDHAIKAEREALKATQLWLKKSQGFYKAGLINLADLSNIKAQTYSHRAMIQSYQSQRSQALSTLSYLVGKKITKIGGLLPIKLPDRKTLLHEALTHRADILAIQTLLKIDKEELRLARSERLPKVALLGALKLHGDSLKLNGDGFSNPNKSFVGAQISYDLFDGFGSKHRIQAAKAQKTARILYLKDYQNRIQADLDAKISTLQALQTKLQADKMQLRAQKRYYKLIKGRYQNHFATTDELSRAIAAKSQATAKLKATEADIFMQKCLILLESSLEMFEKGKKR